MTVDCGTDVKFTGEEHVTIYESSEWAQRGFCSECGTHLFYLLKDDGRYFVPVGLFDSEDQFQFDHQIFIDKKPSFYSFANVTNNMTERTGVRDLHTFDYSPGLHLWRQKPEQHKQKMHAAQPLCVPDHPARS